MSRRATALCLFLALAALRPLSAAEPAGEAFDDDADEPVFWSMPVEWPPASELLAGVRSALPTKPLRIEADLQSKDRRGRLEKTVRVEVLLAWDALRPHAEYTLRDAFGGLLERMVIRRDPEQGLTCAYSAGDPPRPAPAPGLDLPVQDTDVSWLDLSLAYLWWPGGETVGAEKVKGRLCYVVDLPAEEADEQELGGVRLWIEPKAHVMLQAATFGPDGTLLRQVRVKSLKKVDELWVIKDLEVRNLVTRHKTLLRVRSVEPAFPEKPPAEPAQAAGTPAGGTGPANGSSGNR